MSGGDSLIKVYKDFISNLDWKVLKENNDILKHLEYLGYLQELPLL